MRWTVGFLTSVFLFTGIVMYAQDDLVGYWSFDEVEGETFMDQSDNSNNGVVFGATSAQGISGNALQFGGTSDYALIEDHNNNPPAVLESLGEGSISIWFKVDHIPLDHGIAPIFYYGSEAKCDFFDAANEGLIIEVGHSPVHRGSERLYFTIWRNGCTYPSFCFDSNVPITKGAWHHFVAVVGPDYNTGYLNGEEMGNRRYNFGNSSHSQFFEDAIKHERLWLGRGHWDRTTQYLDGAIDELRIYNRPLTIGEVRKLYLDPSAGLPVNLYNHPDPSVLLFPNPATEKIHYTLKDTAGEFDELKLVDASGREQLLQHSNGSTGYLDVHSIDPGIYTLIFTGNTTQVRKTVIIQ